jgi:hypothetical protein
MVKEQIEQKMVKSIVRNVSTRNSRKNIMTKVTKSERKYGKKEPTEKVTKGRRSKKDLDEPLEEMYKVLIDGSGFSKAMNYDGCQELIRKYESNAKRLNRLKPSLVLVKQ